MTTRVPMKVRATHCVELDIPAAALPEMLGHGGARVKQAEVILENGALQGLRVHLEYELATRGVQRRKKVFFKPPEDPWMSQ